MTRAIVLRLVFVLFLSVAAWAQNAEVVGEVHNSNMSPAVNCTVSIGSKFAFTDVRGRFRIINVPFGQYTVQVKKDDHVIKQELVNINQVTAVIPQIVLPDNRCAD